MQTRSLLATALLALSMVGQLQAATTPPDPSPFVVGPPAYYTPTPPSGSSTSSDFASNSATFQAALITWTQMVNSQYSHAEQWYPKLQPPYTANNPQYLFDCVGALSYILYQGAPLAIADVYNYINLKDGLNTGWSVIPRAIDFANYFVTLKTTPSPDWQLITDITAIQPGDVLIVPVSYAQGTAYVGHALLAAGAPMLLSDGSYALLEFDSTGTSGPGFPGHGWSDSRIWDPRNLPCAVCANSDSGGGVGNAGPSGLGRGTIQITPLPTALQSTYPNYPFQISWQVQAQAAGQNSYFAPLIVARPLSNPSTAQIQCLFNWAEKAYPTIFTPANAITQFSSPYIYRQYTSSYLGVSVANNTVYYQGPDGTQLPQGSLSSWLTTANCQ